MTATLVTLVEAKEHLRITTDYEDADIQRKMNAAEEAILDYINRTEDGRALTATWTYDSVPSFVVSAILLLLAELWGHRGDGGADDSPPRDPSTDFSPVILGLLRRITGPVLA